VGQRKKLSNTEQWGNKQLAFGGVVLF
jgi:hypothetical protein